MGHLRHANFELCCVALQLRSDYRPHPSPTTPAAVRTAVSAYACPIWHCGLWLPAVRQARGSPDAALWHQQTAPGIQCSSHNPSRIVVLVCSLTMHCSADVVRRRWADVHLMTSYSHTPGRYGLEGGECYKTSSLIYLFIYFSKIYWVTAKRCLFRPPLNISSFYFYGCSFKPLLEGDTTRQDQS